MSSLLSNFPSSQKRPRAETTETTTTEDPPMPGSLSLVPYSAPGKVRAVAGPSQEQLDEVFLSFHVLSSKADHICSIAKESKF